MTSNSRELRQVVIQQVTDALATAAVTVYSARRFTPSGVR
jgi:hypothetical protein